MKGFYHCNQCNIYIEVLTTIRGKGSDTFVKCPIMLCPHCKNETLHEISKDEFECISTKDYFILKRSYHIKNIGLKLIDVGIKWIT